MTAWGREVGRRVSLPVFLCLDGPLGAGKSVLARSVARGAGASGWLPSPSYALSHTYEIERGKVVHLDLYRLESPDELWELGWEQLGAPGELVLVEWASRALGLLPVDRWEVNLAPVPQSPGLRSVSVEARGDPPLILLPQALPCL